VNVYRYVLKVVPKVNGKEVVAMLKAIHVPGDREASRFKAQPAVEKLGAMNLREAAEIVRDWGGNACVECLPTHTLDEDWHEQDA
jgi:hypothetical protein